MTKNKVEKIERVSLSTVEDGIAVLSLQDELHRNTFHDLFVEQLLARLQRLAGDDSIRVCVVQGLPDVFCAGAHQDLLLELADGKLAASDIVLSKAMLDVPIPNIFETLSINLGTSYVYDFNAFGRIYQVRAQADQQFRMEREDIQRL